MIINIEIQLESALKNSPILRNVCKFDVKQCSNKFWGDKNINYGYLAPYRCQKLPIFGNYEVESRVYLVFVLKTQALKCLKYVVRTP